MLLKNFDIDVAMRRLLLRSVGCRGFNSLIAKLRLPIATPPLIENGSGQLRVRSGGFGTRGELIEVKACARVLGGERPIDHRDRGC